MIPITITGRHFVVTEPIKQYVYQKLERLLEKYPLKLVEAHVMLTQEKYRHTAETTLVGKHLRFTASERTEDMYASIDKLIDNIHKQLGRYHERIKTHRTKRSLQAMVTGTAHPPEADPEATNRPRIIRTRAFATKPMLVEEAALELGITENSFLVFRNADNDKVSVLYKRTDGHYGLIEPD